MWTFSAGSWRVGPERELTAATGRKLTFRRRGGATAEFTIDGRHDEAATIDELITDLHAWRDGTPLFRGRVAPTSDDIGPDTHTVRVTVGDYRNILDRRIVTSDGGPLTDDSGDLAWAFVAATQGDTNGDLGIEAGDGVPSGVNATNFEWKAGQTVAAIVDQVAALDAGGFDWDLAPDADGTLKFNVYPGGRGESRGVILDYGGLLSNAQRNLDPRGYANHLRYSGLADADTVTVADIATRDEGRWESQVGNLEAVGSNTVASQAAKLLDEMGTIVPGWVVTIAPGRWRGPEHVWVGDTCQLVVRSGRLDVDEPMRVEELAVEVAADGSEKVTLTLGREVLDLARQLAATDRRLRQLERL